ncbi:hypothetical protein AAHK20_01330 [Trinickia sp. YCB016]
MDTKDNKDAKDKSAPKDTSSGPKPAAPSTIVAAAPESAAMRTIDAERNALPSDAKALLGAHVLANTVAAINERSFTIETFKPVTLTFSNLRANSKAFLTLRPDQEAIWSDGGQGDRLVGLSISSRVDPVLYVSNFLVNAREMYLQTYQDAQEIQISLYLRTNQQGVRGRVDLPPGASVTLESNDDRSTVIGLSSFAIDLGN